MTVSPRPDSFDLSDYLGVLRRRWWIIIGLTLLGLLGAYAYVKVSPKAYTATTVVYVSANAANANQVAGGRTAGVAVNMDNEAQIVLSDAVAAPAAKALHSKLTAAQLSKHVKVSVPPNTSVLHIGCSASHPGAAVACAQAFANAYLNSRHTAAQNKAVSEANTLRARVVPLQQKVIKLRKKARSLARHSAARAQVEVDITNDDSQLSTLRKDISKLGAAVNDNPGYIITPASRPGSPSSPRKLLYLPSGLIAGLLLGLIGAIAIDRRDDRIHDAADVERSADLPVLFWLRQKRLKPQASLVSPRSAMGRAFTSLAEAVGAGLGDGNHVVIVAAASPGPGGSSTAANLAATLARTRSDTILVSADPQQAVAARMLGIGAGRGLAEMLSGTATVAEVARRPAGGVTRLRVITAGADAPTLANQLDYETSKRLVAELRGEARYVVIEVQAAGEGTDTFGLAEFADAAVVVAESDRTSKVDLTDCVGRLDRMRTPVIGAAVLPATAGWGAKARGAAAEPAESRDARRFQEPPAVRIQRPARMPRGQGDTRDAERGARLRRTPPAGRSDKALPMPDVSVPATSRTSGRYPEAEDASDSPAGSG